MIGKNSQTAEDRSKKSTLSSSIEDMIEKRLEDICTVLSAADKGKNRLHEEVMSIIERSLFKIALKRSNNVKSTAASYLGINRNTFQNKMEKLGLNSSNEKRNNAEKQK
jgi:DNA-binding protein Fis